MVWLVNTKSLTGSGIALFVLASALTGLPLVGAIAGAGGFILSLLHVGPLLIGALVGGVLA